MYKCLCKELQDANKLTIWLFQLYNKDIQNFMNTITKTLAIGSLGKDYYQGVHNNLAKEISKLVSNHKINSNFFCLNLDKGATEMKNNFRGNPFDKLTDQMVSQLKKQINKGYMNHKQNMNNLLALSNEILVSL